MEPIERILLALYRSWDIDTTYLPETWTEENQAHGQCAVSSLVIQDRLGGELLKGVVDAEGERIIHYWNLLDFGEFDSTWDQFPKDSVVSIKIPAVREDLLGSRWMNERYKRLSSRVEDHLAKDVLL